MSNGKKLQLSFNSPVILGFTIACFISQRYMNLFLLGDFLNILQRKLSQQLDDREFFLIV